jgi:hypothetical protein
MTAVGVESPFYLWLFNLKSEHQQNPPSSQRREHFSKIDLVGGGGCADLMTGAAAWSKGEMHS